MLCDVFYAFVLPFPKWRGVEIIYFPGFSATNLTPFSMFYFPRVSILSIADDWGGKRGQVKHTFLRSAKQASKRVCSVASIFPTSWILATPSGPSSTLEAKNSTPWSLYSGLSTNVGSTTPFSPEAAFNRLSAKRAPAMAMERVAEPAPSLAATTSSPPNCTRLRRAASPTRSGCEDWEKRGTMVTPE